VGEVDIRRSLAIKFGALQAAEKLWSWVYDKRRLFDYPITHPDYDYQQYIIEISSITNDWTEEIQMKKEPGPYLGSPTPAPWHWSRALTVSAPGNRVIVSDIDPDYPKGAQNQPIHFGVSSAPPQR
jgi:hypothetical protein